MQSACVSGLQHVNGGISGRIPASSPLLYTHNYYILWRVGGNAVLACLNLRSVLADGCKGSSVLNLEVDAEMVR